MQIFSFLITKRSAKLINLTNQENGNQINTKPVNLFIIYLDDCAKLQLICIILGKNQRKIVTKNMLIPTYFTKNNKQNLTDLTKIKKFWLNCVRAN